MSYYVTHLSSPYLSHHTAHREKAGSQEDREKARGESVQYLHLPETMSVYTATLLEDQARRARVADMMRAGDWRGVINTFQGGELDRDPLLVWIRPSIDLLLFIKEELRQLGLNSLSSVGCGNGALGKTEQCCAEVSQ